MMERKRPTLVMVLAGAVVVTLYLAPNIYETEHSIFYYRFFGFLIFFCLSIYLVAAVKISKKKSLSLAILISVSLQILQSALTPKEVEFAIILYNFLGSLLGSYGVNLLVHVIKVIFLLLNKYRNYDINFSDGLESLADLNKTSNKTNSVTSFIVYIVRQCHFAFNKIIAPKDNIKMLLKTDLPHSMLFPVMSPLIIRHLLHGTFEKDTSVIFSEQISPGMIVWDIGAHYGYYSLMASCLTGEKGKVLSFEPTPSTFQTLHENTKSISNVSIFNVGFYSENTQLTFNDYGENFSALNSLYEPRVNENIKYQKRFLVNLTKADDFLLKSGYGPNLIKMDCESCELEVLKGMENILDYHNPYIIMELGDILKKDIPRSRPIVEFMHSKNYKAFRRFKEGYAEIEVQESYPYFNAFFVHANKIQDFTRNNHQI